jgi:hypothetical protein
MMMSVEQWVEWELAGETEVFGENLSQYHFDHNKWQMAWPVIELGKPATNRLSYGSSLVEMKRDGRSRTNAVFLVVAQ